MPDQPKNPKNPNPAAQTAGALGKAFADLGIPRVLGWMFVSAALTVLLAVGLWYLLDWLLTGYEFFSWGWANWLLDTFAGVALFFLVLLILPALLILVTSLFLDYIVDAVEDRHYPDLPKPRELSVVEIVVYLVKFTGLLLLVNLLILPLYLLLPGINFLISWTVNGYLVGREYFEMIAMRRMEIPNMKYARRAHGGRIFTAGFIMTMLMTVPLLNLIMPVVGAAYMTHIYHGLHSLPGAAAAHRAGPGGESLPSER